MPNEEGFLVVVGVDKPASNTLCRVANDLTRLRLEYVNTIHLNLYLIVVAIQKLDIRLAKNNEQVPFTSILEILGHVQVGVHTSLEYWDSAELIELAGVGVVVESAGDQHVEVSIACLAGCSH